MYNLNVWNIDLYYYDIGILQGRRQEIFYGMTALTEVWTVWNAPHVNGGPEHSPGKC